MTSEFGDEEEVMLPALVYPWEWPGKQQTSRTDPEDVSQPEFLTTQPEKEAVDDSTALGQEDFITPDEHRRAFVRLPSSASARQKVAELQAQASAPSKHTGGSEKGSKAREARAVFHSVEERARQRKIPERVTEDDIVFVFMSNLETPWMTIWDILGYLEDSFPHWYPGKPGRELVREIEGVLAFNQYFERRSTNSEASNDAFYLTRGGHIAYSEYASITWSVIEFRQHFGPFVPLDIQEQMVVEFCGPDYFDHETVYIAIETFRMMQACKPQLKFEEHAIEDYLLRTCAAYNYSLFSMKHLVIFSSPLDFYGIFDIEEFNGIVYHTIAEEWRHVTELPDLFRLMREQHCFDAESDEYLQRLYNVQVSVQPDLNTYFDLDNTSMSVQVEELSTRFQLPVIQ